MAYLPLLASGMDLGRVARIAAAAFGEVPIRGCIGLGDAFNPFDSQEHRDQYDAMTSDQQYEVSRALGFENASRQAEYNAQQYGGNLPPGPDRDAYVASQLAIANFTPDGNYINPPPREQWLPTSDPHVLMSSTTGTFRPAAPLATEDDKADYARATVRVLGGSGADQAGFVKPSDIAAINAAIASGALPPKPTPEELQAFIVSITPALQQPATKPFVVAGVPLANQPASTTYVSSGAAANNAQPPVVVNMTVVRPSGGGGGGAVPVPSLDSVPPDTTTVHTLAGGAIPWGTVAIGAAAIGGLYMLSRRGRLRSRRR